MGDYLECLFPFLKIRYISINDNYDSADYKGTTGGLDVVLRNIVYDSYSKDPGSKNHVGKADNQRWGCYTIRRILDKLTYTGAAVGMMKCNVAPCSKVRKEMKRDEWIVVPGMHEPLVSEEGYQKVQKSIHSNPAGERNNTPFPLKSLVVCGYCGRRMARWNSKFTRNPRFYCTYGGKYGNITCKDVKSPFECELVFT